MRWIVLAFCTVVMACIGIFGTIYGLLLMLDNLNVVRENGESWSTLLTRQNAIFILATGGVFIIGSIVAYTASEILDYVESRASA